MKNSKISKILRSFNEIEIKGLEGFMKSTFFSGGRNYLPLFKNIKKYYPDFDSPDFTLQSIYSSLYNRKFNKPVIKTMISGLTEQAENFLVLLSLKENRSVKYRLLASELRERKLLGYFKSINKEAEKELEISRKKNYEYFYDKYMLTHENSIVELSGMLGYKDSEPEINKTETIFFKYVILRLCELYQSIIMDNKFIRKKSNNLKYYDLMMNYLSKNQDSEDISFTVYLNFYMLLQTDNYGYYTRLKELLGNSYGVFNISEEKNFYVTMHNYLLVKYEDEKNVSLDEYLCSLNLLIDKGYLTQNDGFINPAAITNAALLVDKLDDTISLEKFINENIIRINPLIRESESFRLRSVLFFKRNLFEYSLKEASKVKTDNYNLKLFTDVLKLMNYYELNDPEPVENIIKTNLRYLKNHPEIPERRNAGFKNFALVYRKLLDKKFYYREINKEELMHLTEKVNSPFRKKWLLNKINQFA